MVFLKLRVQAIIGQNTRFPTSYFSLINSLCNVEFVSDIKNLKEKMAENRKDSIPSSGTM